MTRAMSRAQFRQGIDTLMRGDSDLAASAERWGLPPFWTHPPGLSGIVISILAQQVSLESAQAAFSRLESGLKTIDPTALAKAGVARLRGLGITRQKAAYLAGLARSVSAGEFKLHSLASMTDDEARAELLAVRGIGPWTADCVLLFSLRRADAWPTGDLALAKAAQEVKGLPMMPSWSELDQQAEDWRPWRAVAARMLWHHYLCVRGRAASM
jgi:DNA-3-methyladenine glycosylase II